MPNSSVLGAPQRLSGSVNPSVMAAVTPLSCTVLWRTNSELDLGGPEWHPSVLMDSIDLYSLYMSVYIYIFVIRQAILYIPYP